MKKLLLSVLLLPVLALAQTVTVEKRVQCGNSEAVISELAKTYREQPIFIGKKADSSVVVYVSSISGTWTVLQVSQQTACILETSEGFKFKPEVLGKQVHYTH